MIILSLEARQKNLQDAPPQKKRYQKNYFSLHRKNGKMWKKCGNTKNVPRTGAPRKNFNKKEIHG